MTSTIQTVTDAYVDGKVAAQNYAAQESNPHPPQSHEWHAWISAWHSVKAWTGIITEIPS